MRFVFTLITLKTVAALTILAIGIVSGLYPIRKKHKAPLEQPESAHLGEALASGIFLGAAFFHLLPDSIRGFTAIYPSIDFPIPELVCVAGFLLLLFLERLTYTKPSQKSVSFWIPYILALTLIIHALTEGAALGLGPNLSEATMLFIAIIAHKGSASFALATMLLRYTIPLRQAVIAILLFSLMTPLGIFLGVGINSFSLGGHNALVEAMFNAFAAGTFLYISTLHHVHFHKHAHETQGLVEFFALTFGVVVMGLIAVWA